MKISIILSLIILLGVGCNSVGPSVVTSETFESVSSTIELTDRNAATELLVIALPSEVQKHIPPHFLPRKKIMLDMNGDGIDDYVLNVENLETKEAALGDLNYFMIIDGATNESLYFSRDFSGRSIKMTPLESANGRRGLFVGYENGGAGTYFSWAVFFYQNGAIQKLIVDSGTELAKIDREDLGYDDAGVVGKDTVVETFPGYSKSKPTGRCCPSEPDVHIEYRFTGESLNLLRVYSEKNKPVSLHHLCATT